MSTRILPTAALLLLALAPLFVVPRLREPAPLPERVRLTPTLDPDAPHGVRIPRDPFEAMDELERLLPEEVLDTLCRLPEERQNEAVGFVMWLGMGMRLNWEMWHWGPDDPPSPLRDWFDERGIRNGDESSSIVLTCFLRRLRGEPIRLEEELRRAREAQLLASQVHDDQLPECGPGVGSIETGTRRMRIDVHIDGGICVRGRPFDADTVTLEMMKHAECLRDDDHPAFPSRVSFVLRCHKLAPWNAVREILDSCRRPEVRAPDVFFEVRPAKEWDTRYLATPLVREFDPSAARGPRSHWAHVRRSPLGDEALAALRGALEAREDPWEGGAVRVTAADDVRAEAVVRVLALLRKLGAERFDFAGPPPAEPGVAADAPILLDGRAVPGD
jgi:hypothetical protein